MTRATVRDLRYNFPAIERRLRRGEEIEITKRGEPIGRLKGVLPPAPARLPDFALRAKRVLGGKRLNAATLVSYARGKY